MSSSISLSKTYICFRTFILKCLYRQYGFDALKAAVDNVASEWILQDIELKVTGYNFLSELTI